MFEAKKVIPEEMEEAALAEGSGYAWRFAASGGVSGAVKRAMEEQGINFDLKAVPCSGVEACKIALLKAGKGILDSNFIEGMICEGGCIQGPANLIRSPRNKGELEKQARLSENVPVKKEN